MNREEVNGASMTASVVVADEGTLGNTGEAGRSVGGDLMNTADESSVPIDIARTVHSSVRSRCLARASIHRGQTGDDHSISIRQTSPQAK